MSDLCQKCKATSPIYNEKYCQRCKKIVIRELDATGYLTPRPKCDRLWRTRDHREDIHETKYGIDR